MLRIGEVAIDHILTELKLSKFLFLGILVNVKWYLIIILFFILLIWI